MNYLAFMRVAGDFSKDVRPPSMCCKWLIVKKFCHFNILSLSKQLSKCRDGFVTAFCFCASGF